MSSDELTVGLTLSLPPYPAIPGIPTSLGSITITLPGGGSIAPFIGPDDALTACKQISSMVNQLNPALAGIAPTLLIMDVLMALQSCATAVPDSITEGDPSLLFESLAALAQTITALLCGLYPPFAFPAFIISLIQFLIATLQCIVGQISEVCEARQRISNRMSNLGSGSQRISLAASFDQIAANLDAREANIMASLESMGPIFELANSFIETANSLSPIGDLMPSLDVPDTTGLSCEDALAPLVATIEALSSFSAILPDCS